MMDLNATTCWHGNTVETILSGKLPEDIGGTVTRRWFEILHLPASLPATMRYGPAARRRVGRLASADLKSIPKVPDPRLAEATACLAIAPESFRTAVS